MPKLRQVKAQAGNFFKAQAPRLSWTWADFETVTSISSNDEEQVKILFMNKIYFKVLEQVMTMIYYLWIFNYDCISPYTAI